MNLICPSCNCYIVSKRAHKKYCSAKYGSSIAINGRILFYDCELEHEHTVDCLTQDMIDALSEEVYGNAE